MANVLSDFAGPIIMDYPAGHTDPFITLPLGRTISLQAEDKIHIQVLS